MRLRTVEAEDVAAYRAMRCDARMMADLGGPQRLEDMPGQVGRDIAAVQAGRAWIDMVVIADADGERVAGTVTLYEHAGQEGGRTTSEIGWMILPGYQGRGLAKAAVTAVLARARDAERWGEVHAWPAVSNMASNRLCASLGFFFHGEEEVVFRGETLATKHWSVTTATA